MLCVDSWRHGDVNHPMTDDMFTLHSHETSATQAAAVKFSTLHSLFSVLHGSSHHFPANRVHSFDYRCSRLYSLEVLFLIIKIPLSSENNSEQYVILFIPPNSL
jgi:hypothetical protein